MTPRHEMALAYARLGIPIFPCIVNGKQPATKNSFKDATINEEIINRWWGIADYNIGLEPDKAGWCVIDIDPRHRGDESWEHLQTSLHDIPTTRTVITPSGGRHLYFYGSLPPSVGKLGPGLDTRGRNSYVLVPPSVIDGVEYRDARQMPYEGTVARPGAHDVYPYTSHDYGDAHARRQPIDLTRRSS